MQPAPLHVNQFAAGGRFPNGTSSVRVDCMVACGVMELDAATGGRIRPSTTQLRAAQNDQVGGIGLDDLAVAFPRFGVSMSQGAKLWPALQARWRAGDGSILAGNYAVVPRPESSQPGGRFAHAIRVQRYSRPGYLIVNDPIASGQAEWRESVVRRFYVSGLGRAGWATGTAVTNATLAGANVPAPPPWINDDAHVLTHGDLEAFRDWVLTVNRDAPNYRALELEINAIFFPNFGDTTTKNYEDKTVGELRRDIPALFAPATVKDFGKGLDIGSAIAAIPAALGELAKRAGQVIFILILLLLGIYVLATANDTPGG